MSRKIAFIGPSLPPARRPASKVEYFPPARHGDLFALSLEPGDRVLILDGVYQHTLPLRHKEIMHHISEGVHVSGAASLGALRAAELGRHGMRGIGRVHDWFAGAVLNADADVALLHADEEADYRPLTIPVVDVLGAAENLRSRGTDVPVQEFVMFARSVHFTRRTARALQEEVPAHLADALEHVLQYLVSSGSVKSQDALLALQDLDGVGSFAVTPTTAFATSSYSRQWGYEATPVQVGTLTPTRAELMAYAQVALEDFPERHLSYVLRVCGASDPQTALRQAGVWDGTVAHAQELIDRWPDKLASSRTLDENLQKVLVRSFRLPGGRLIYDELADEAVEGLPLAQLCKEWRALRSLARGSAQDLPEQVLASLWHIRVADLPFACLDRGFRDIREVRHALRSLTAGLVMLAEDGSLV